LRDSSSISIITTGSSSRAGLGKIVRKVSKEVVLKLLKISKGFNKGKKAKRTAKGSRLFFPNDVKFMPFPFV
jgi:hypothetical protein